MKKRLIIAALLVACISVITGSGVALKGRLASITNTPPATATNTTVQTTAPEPQPTKTTTTTTTAPTQTAPVVPVAPTPTPLVQASNTQYPDNPAITPTFDASVTPKITYSYTCTTGGVTFTYFDYKDHARLSYGGSIAVGRSTDNQTLELPAGSASSYIVVHFTDDCTWQFSVSN